MTDKRAAKCKLPTVPAVAQRLLDAVSDPCIGMQEIIGIVKLDTAIAARVLKTANSPLYGARQPINDVDRGVVWLGLQMVTRIALSVVAESRSIERHNAVELSRGACVTRGIQSETSSNTNVTNRPTSTRMVTIDVG